MSRTYIVIPEKDVTHEMLVMSLNRDGTYRKSQDGTQSILKFYDEHPDCCAGFLKYTHAEIVTYLETNAIDWTEADVP